MSEYITGLDTSHWEDDVNPTMSINWQMAKDNGIKFVILKATEGVAIKDSVFIQGKNNLNGLLPRGSYHFYRSSATVAQQAKYYFDYSGKLELPPVLDLEDYYQELPTGKALVIIAVNMLKAIDDQFGQEAILYTSPNIIKNYIGSYITSELLSRKLWIAHYGINTPAISPFSHWTFWQYSESQMASTYGIVKSNTVDINYYNGTEMDFYTEFNIDPSIFNKQLIPQMIKDLFTALNAHDLDQIVSLYHPDGIHIADGQFIQGSNAIKTWYATFLNITIPFATFNILSASKTETIVQVAWQAVSHVGNIKNGIDTLGIMNGKIALLNSSFTITPPLIVLPISNSSYNNNHPDSTSPNQSKRND